MFCVVHSAHPSVYSAIQGPKMPAARVRTTSGASSGTRKRSTPAPMFWIQRSRGARPSSSGGNAHA
jgi:hypothetical protein